MNIFAVYKPKGPTSYDIIHKIKKATGEKKVGHAGTLDPLAKGVLVIGIGREATKKLKDVVVQEKEYLATIRLGATSTTDDSEGPVSVLPLDKGESEGVEGNKIKKVIKSFVGKIKQIPPAYSAIKIKGQRAYKLARQGKTPELKPRTVEIRGIELISYKWPYLKIKVTTGPGVYIRSLARNIGDKLKVGGYLYNLERTRVGRFTKNQCLKIEELKP